MYNNNAEYPCEFCCTRIFGVFRILSVLCDYCFIDEYMIFAVI